MNEDTWYDGNGGTYPINSQWGQQAYPPSATPPGVYNNFQSSYVPVLPTVPQWTQPGPYEYGITYNQTYTTSSSYSYTLAPPFDANLINNGNFPPSPDLTSVPIPNFAVPPPQFNLPTSNNISYDNVANWNLLDDRVQDKGDDKRTYDDDDSNRIETSSRHYNEKDSYKSRRHSPGHRLFESASSTNDERSSRRKRSRSPREYQSSSRQRKSPRQVSSAISNNQLDGDKRRVRHDIHDMPSRRSSSLHHGNSPDRYRHKGSAHSPRDVPSDRRSRMYDRPSRMIDKVVRRGNERRSRDCESSPLKKSSNRQESSALQDKTCVSNALHLKRSSRWKSSSQQKFSPPRDSLHFKKSSIHDSNINLDKNCGAASSCSDFLHNSSIKIAKEVGWNFKTFDSDQDIDMFGNSTRDSRGKLEALNQNTADEVYDQLVSPSLTDIVDPGIKEETTEEIITPWVRSAASDLYYKRDDTNPLVMHATKKLVMLCENFEKKLLKINEKDVAKKTEKFKTPVLKEEAVASSTTVELTAPQNDNKFENEAKDMEPLPTIEIEPYVSVPNGPELSDSRPDQLSSLPLGSGSSGTDGDSAADGVSFCSTTVDVNVIDADKAMEDVATCASSRVGDVGITVVNTGFPKEVAPNVTDEPKENDCFMSNTATAAPTLCAKSCLDGTSGYRHHRCCKSQTVRRRLPPSREMNKRGVRYRCPAESFMNDDSSNDDSSAASSGDEDWGESSNHFERISREMERKRSHPQRLHPELWFNEEGQMNDGPACRCSLKARRSGIRHGIYVGEKTIHLCDPWTNNSNQLYHYLITMSPPTNFLVKTPTVITHDGHEFIFEGFSMLSHEPLKEVPTCRVIRFNIEYTILYLDEKMPETFCVRELDLFFKYIFVDLLELADLNMHPFEGEEGCPLFHFMPRFVRRLPDNGKEILSMNEVLSFLIKSRRLLVQPEGLATLLNMTQYQWQNYADRVKGMIVTKPGLKPSSIRVDQLDRDQLQEEIINYPMIVHFGIRPVQLSYAGNPEYQRAWREYVKFRHLVANMSKPSYLDKRKLEAKETALQKLRTTSKMRREVTVAIAAEGFYSTGLMCDVVQHAMLLPVLICHLRFHRSLDQLEDHIQYKFHNRALLQLALTHPSYRENFGTNPDHARNSLTNCGIRQPEYGDRRIHYQHTRKRGINTLINIMSRFGKSNEAESKIVHNERLEFLGDAVVEFLSSIHLFHLFRNLEEGGLATYRAAIVQNQHLAVLGDKLQLDKYMLYAHGADLCHDYELRHAMANCFEALMGAIFIDTGIESADSVFSLALFQDESALGDIWVHYPLHPLQEQEPDGDRKWIDSFPNLSKLAEFENTIGIQFRHIRLLARAFTDRSIGFNNLTLGSNQRLEFLGDSVLQLVSSEFLYRHFPQHHEGHLSLLRSSLVNNRTQAVVCEDLGMTQFAMYSHLKTELKTKDRADLLEAFLGALYVDQGLTHCRKFCEVCFYPRLNQFIMNQDWNDPKSKLQQCCLTLRTMDVAEPDIPIYKVIECKGPTNTRVYTVAVYFRGRRLAKASGHSIQMAEMNAAQEALAVSKDQFRQLDYQKRVIERNIKYTGRNDKRQSRKDVEDEAENWKIEEAVGENKKKERKEKNRRYRKDSFHNSTWPNT